MKAREQAAAFWISASVEVKFLDASAKVVSGRPSGETGDAISTLENLEYLELGCDFHCTRLRTQPMIYAGA
jgi:hypothetical protein